MNKRNIRRISVLLLVAIFSLGLYANLYASTVGGVLANPETGWKRIDNTDSAFVFTGKHESVSNSDFYNGSAMRVANGQEGSVKFKFYGTKFRIISFRNYSEYSTNIEIKVDGIVSGSYSSIGPLAYRVLSFEKTDLSLGLHTVEITPKDITTYGTTLDAVDIDETGYLVSYDSPTIENPSNVIASAENAKVTLGWNAVNGATSYNIKRAISSGGPYTTIGNSATAAYTDITVTNGTTYYYVVTAVNAQGESVNSNEASATPQAPVIPGGSNAILELVMTNGTIKEFDFTRAELNSFLEWYDNRSAGSGKGYYVFEKKSNIKPFISRKEYISFDKIFSFEVNEYNE